MVAGVECYPHVGEWIEVGGELTVGDTLVRSELRASPPEEVDQRFQALCEVVAQHVVAWNWTDLKWQLLPSPYHNAAVLRALLHSEIYWLYWAIDRKADDPNAGAGSLPTS